MSITYRRATLADLAALYALNDEVNLLHHTALPRVFALPSCSGQDVIRWKEAILGKASAVFVAEREIGIVGFVAGQIEDETATQFHPVRFCRLGTLAVTEADRGQGIGRALIGALERWATTHHAVELHLNVWSFNVKAAKLYEELGYEVRAHFMVKTLSPDGA